MITPEVLKAFCNHIEKVAAEGTYDWTDRKGRKLTTTIKLGKKSPGKKYKKEPAAGKDDKGKYTWTHDTVKKAAFEDELEKISKDNEQIAKGVAIGATSGGTAVGLTQRRILKDVTKVYGKGQSYRLSGSGYDVVREAILKGKTGRVLKGAAIGAGLGTAVGFALKNWKKKQ